MGAERCSPGGFPELRIKPQVPLSKHRSAISQDTVGEPRAILIPCWSTVSVIYTAVENASSSCYAAQLTLTGVGHCSSWLSQKTALALLQLPLVQKCFPNFFVWRPLKQTRDHLFYNFPLSSVEFVMTLLCKQYLEFHPLSQTFLKLENALTLPCQS